MDSHRIQSIGGFIQNQDRRAGNEGTCKSKALLHTKGILFCQTFSKAFQSYQFQNFRHTAFWQSQNTPDQIQVFFSCKIAIESRGFNKRTNVF